MHVCGTDDQETETSSDSTLLTKRHTSLRSHSDGVAMKCTILHNVSRMELYLPQNNKIKDAKKAEKTKLTVII